MTFAVIFAKPGRMTVIVTFARLRAKAARISSFP